MHSTGGRELPSPTSTPKFGGGIGNRRGTTTPANSPAGLDANKPLTLEQQLRQRDLKLSRSASGSPPLPPASAKKVAQPPPPPQQQQQIVPQPAVAHDSAPADATTAAPATLATPPAPPIEGGALTRTTTNVEGGPLTRTTTNAPVPVIQTDGGIRWPTASGLGGPVAPGGSDSDLPGNGDSSLALSRQMSQRVLRETEMLARRMGMPASPTRIAAGTGEVYTVVDRGTGDRAIFKPASQRKRRLSSSGIKSSSGSGSGGSAGSWSEPSTRVGPLARTTSSSYSGSSGTFGGRAEGGGVGCVRGECAGCQGGQGGLGGEENCAGVVVPSAGQQGEREGKEQEEGSGEEEDVDEQTHQKEVAAYLLDHYGFAGVLPTVMAEVELRGTAASGMIQLYLEHEQNADEDEWGRRQIQALDVHQVHAVGTLDVRLFNQDRHGGNLLLDDGLHGTNGGSSSGSSSGVSGISEALGRSGSGGSSGGSGMHLVPIDHEMIMPSWKNLEAAKFCWLDWSQANKPFDEETKAYVRALDPVRDVALLRPLHLPEASIATYRICTEFLKIGVDRDLTLREIGNMMVRDPASCPHDIPCEWPCEPSVLETLVAEAAAGGDRFGDAEIERFRSAFNGYLDKS